MEGFLVLLIGAAAFYYAFRSTWRATSPEASRARRINRAMRKQDIEDEARSRRQGEMK